MKNVKVIFKGLVFLFFVLTNNVIYPQNNTFQKFYDNVNDISSLLITKNNNYFVLGDSYIPQGQGATGIYLLKTDSAGNKIWSKYYSNNTDNLSGVTIIQSNDGNCVIGGMISRPIAHGETPLNIFLNKIDSNGDTLWWKRYGNPLLREYISSIIQTSDNGYLVAGFGQDTLYGPYLGFLLKVNSNGDSLWSKYFRIGESSTYFNYIIRSFNNNYLILGTTDSLSLASQVFTKCNIVQVDSTGKILLQQTLGDYGDYYPLSKIVLTKDSNYVFIALQKDSSNLIKISPIAQIISAKVLDFDANNISGTNDGGFILTNKLNSSEITLEKLDSTGNKQWSKQIPFNTSDVRCADIYQTADSSYVLTGSVQSSGMIFSYLIKTNSLGDFILDVKDSHQELSGFNLSQNYPNPFNPTTIINYSIPKTSFVSLKVYNVLGKEVAVLINEVKPAGNYNAEFNSGKIASGIYFYRIIAGQFSSTRKMILLK